MLRKYNEHVLIEEKKDMKAEKSAIEEKILKLFKEKPEIKASGVWPDSKGIYSLANIKKYVGGDTLKIDQTFNELSKDSKIKFIRVKIMAYKETYPFYYHEDYTSKEEAEKCKADMEKSQKPAPKVVAKREPEDKRKIAKKKDVEAKPKAPRKPRAKKAAPTEGEAKAKAVAYVRRKKG